MPIGGAFSPEVTEVGALEVLRVEGDPDCLAEAAGVLSPKTHSIPCLKQLLQCGLVSSHF